MNCRRFQDQLYEYVEGTLSAGDRAAAERHLAGCSDCRQAVLSEQRLASTLSGRFREDTKNLALKPEIKQRILAAARQQAAPPTIAEYIAGIWKRVALPTAVGLAFVLIVTLLLVTHFSSQRIHEMTQDTATKDSANQYTPPSVSIQMSCPVSTYQFHREGDRVVDTLSYEKVVASGTFRLDSQNPVHL